MCLGMLGVFYKRLFTVNMSLVVHLNVQKLQLQCIPEGEWKARVANFLEPL